jgi:hypothetical protein
MMSDDDNDFFTIPNFPVSTPPEDVLEILVAELKRPIISIEGVAQILSEVELREQHREMWKSVSQMTPKMKHLLEMAETYVEERRNQQSKNL